MKIIKQWSNILEPNHNLEKVLRNFSDLITIFSNPRYKVCQDTFNEWLKLTSQLRISAKTHLADISTEVPKSYKVNFEGKINDKSAKEISKSKKDWIKILKNSTKKSFIPSKRQTFEHKTILNPKFKNSMRKGSELGMSRSFTRPSLHNDNKAKNHWNIHIDKETNENEQWFENSQEQQMKSHSELDLMKNLNNFSTNKIQGECKNDKNSSFSSNTIDSKISNDSESMDEPNKHPPQQEEKVDESPLNLYINSTNTFKNQNKCEDIYLHEEKADSNDYLLKISEKENTGRSIFEPETSNDWSESPIKDKNSTKLSKWVENVMYSSYQENVLQEGKKNYNQDLNYDSECRNFIPSEKKLINEKDNEQKERRDGEALLSIDNYREEENNL